MTSQFDLAAKYRALDCLDVLGHVVVRPDRFLEVEVCFFGYRPMLFEEESE